MTEKIKNEYRVEYFVTEFRFFVNGKTTCIDPGRGQKVTPIFGRSPEITPNL